MKMLLLLTFVLAFISTSARAADVPIVDEEGYGKFLGTTYINLIEKEDFIRHNWKPVQIIKDGLNVHIGVNGFDKDGAPVLASVWSIAGEFLSPEFLQSATLIVTKGDHNNTCNVTFQSRGRTVKAELIVGIRGTPMLIEETK